MAENKSKKISFWTYVCKEGIATLTLNCKDDKVNKLTSPVLREFQNYLKEIRSDSAVKLLAICSAKKDMFIAGADIDEIKNITTPDEAAKKAQAGQGIFNQLEDMPMPTVACINGICLGGGLELALACTWRIAVDSARCKIGLPEVSLGIIPGFGGTQRLPKLIGLTKSLPILLSGKPLTAPKAYKAGVVDLVIAEVFWKQSLDQTLLQLVSNSALVEKIAARRRQTGLSAVAESNRYGVKFIIAQARRQTVKKTKGHYPAPLALLEVLEQTANVSREQGLDIEAKRFSYLAPGAICKNLVQLFYSSEALKKDPGKKIDAEPLPVQRTAVVGAGVMGGGISWALTKADIAVRLKDINWEAIGLGYTSAQKIYDHLVSIKKMRRNEVTVKMARLSSTLDYSGFKNCDVVIEAVVEKAEVKKNVLAEIQRNVSEQCVVATNTSALDIDALAAELQHPEQFCGMHFFNPVNRMPLVEIIPGKNTSEQTIQTLVSLSRKLGKTPIVVGNCPGFLVNRILIPYIVEAAWLLEQGATVEHIDQTLEQFGMPMGPLRLSDEVGLDVGYHVAEFLCNAFSDRYLLAPSLKNVATELGLRGKKGGAGFYLYNEKNIFGNKKIQLNPEIDKLLGRPQKGPSSEITTRHIIDRTLLVMVNEATRCLQENIVCSAAYLDMALVMGCGFPPFRGGLLRYADFVGINEVHDTLGELSQKYGNRFEPTELLVQMAKKGATFYE